MAYLPTMRETLRDANGRGIGIRIVVINQRNQKVYTDLATSLAKGVAFNTVAAYVLAQLQALVQGGGGPVGSDAFTADQLKSFAIAAGSQW